MTHDTADEGTRETGKEKYKHRKGMSRMGAGSKTKAGAGSETDEGGSGDEVRAVYCAWFCYLINLISKFRILSEFSIYIFLFVYLYSLWCKISEGQEFK